MNKRRPLPRLDPDLSQVIGSVKASIPRGREKEVLRELTWRRMKEKYGLEDLNEQELERARNRLRRLIEAEDEEG